MEALRRNLGYLVKLRLILGNLNRLRLLDVIRILRYGWKIFDLKYYVASSKSKRSKISAFLYFAGNGIWSGRRINHHFQVDDYRNSFPQSSLKSSFPFLHYLAKSSGANPITSFDRRYLQLNADLKDFDGPLLFHFMKFRSTEDRYMDDEFEIQNSKYRINVKLPLSNAAYSLPFTNIALEIFSSKKPTISDSDSIQRKKQIQVRTSVRSTEIMKNLKSNLKVRIKSSSNTLHIFIESEVTLFLDVKWLRDLLMRYSPEESYEETEFSDTLYFLLSSVSNRVPENVQLLSDKFAFSLNDFGKLHLEPKSHQIIFSDRSFNPDQNSTILGKKILLVSHEDSYTGAPLYLLQLANFLRDRGLEVLVLCVRPRLKSGVFSSQGFKTFYVEDLSTQELMNREWLLTDLGKSLLTEFLLEIAPFQIWVNSINASCVIELIHVLNTPTCLFVHESFGFMSKDYLANEYEVMFRRSLERAHLVVFGSEYSKNSFCQNDIRTNGVVMNSLKTNNSDAQDESLENRISRRNQMGIDPAGTVFLSMATFEPRKRIEDIIHAFENAAPPNSYLILVGYVENDRYSNRLKGEVGGKSNIFVYPVSKDTAHFFSISDVLIFASESETYPLVLQEAVHWDLLRIVSKFPGFGASCNEDTALMFEIGDLEQLESLIKKTSSNFQSSQHLKTAAKLDFSKKEDLYIHNLTSIVRNLSLVNVSLEDLE